MIQQVLHTTCMFYYLYVSIWQRKRLDFLSLFFSCLNVNHVWLTHSAGVISYGRSVHKIGVINNRVNHYFLFWQFAYGKFYYIYDC